MPTRETLRKERLYEKMFQNSTIGILLVDREGIIIQANDYVIRLFGYTEKELLGQNVNILLPKPLRTLHQTHVANFYKKPMERSMGIGLDLKGARKDGSLFPLEVSLGHTQIEGHIFAIAYVSDISERKKIEQDLADYQSRLLNYTEDLELRVMQRTKDLERALEKEKELGILKSRFVSIASHEFRTPLSSILSSTELLEFYMQKGRLERGEKNINRIKASVRHLTNILNDFLSLEKLESSKIKLSIESTNIKDWAEELLEELQPTLKEGQQILLTLDTQPILHLDSYLTKSLLLNLLSNASKYSPSNSSIQLQLLQNQEELTIIVKDEGLGVPLSEQTNLFTRFFRASNVENIQGTGLGLTIVKRYVDLMSGTIGFESREGGGSTFIVKLPVVS